MKKIVILLFLVQTFFAFSQEPPKMLKYNAKNSANIFYYDLEEAPVKMKIKNDALKNKALKHLRNYNYKVKDISFLNSAKLYELEVLVNTMGPQVRTNRDLGLKIRKQIETTILPIRDTIATFEKKLNLDLEGILSSKQYKKWLKYQTKVKRELIPKPPQAKGTQRTRMPMNQRNRRRF